MDVLARYSGGSDPRATLVLFAILAVVLAVIVIWYGVRNLDQAKSISRHFGLRRLKEHIGEIVTIFGKPEPLQEVFGLGRSKVLWFQRRVQRLEGLGKHRHWKTVRTETRSSDFHVCFEDGGRVLVKCRPKEIQGKHSVTSGGGAFSTSRTITEWLPLFGMITVTARLELRDKGATLMPDRKFGMFISGHDPSTAAALERGKGIAGVSGGALLIAVAIALIAIALSF